MSAPAAEMVEKSQGKNWTRYLLPSLGDMIFISIFIAVVVLGPRLMNMDGDLGRHLTIGGYILDEFSIPTRDIFSHTMSGMHLTPHEWLAQVIFALSYRLGGLDGVVLLCAIILAGTFTIVFTQSYTRSKIILISLTITVLAAAAASVHWLARPHIFTLLFTVLWVGELEKWRLNKPWRWWMLPLIMLVWVNTHGAFIVGIVIWLTYLGGIYISRKLYSIRWLSKQSQETEPLPSSSETRHLLLVGLLVLAISLINPAGWRVWSTTFGFLQNNYLVSHTVEYQAPDFQLTSFWPFMAMICLSIFLGALSRKKLPMISVLLIVSWTAFSLISARNIAIYAAITAPILAGVAADILKENEIFTAALNFDGRLRLVDDRLAGHIWPVIACLLISTAFFFGSGDRSGVSRNQFSVNLFPVTAVNWIEDNPSDQPIFNYFPWGGYLLFRMWPAESVFIDGQTDFYGEPLTREYEKVITLAEGWQGVLTKYQVGRVLMPQDAVLVERLSQMNGWELVYLDHTAAILDYYP